MISSSELDLHILLVGLNPSLTADLWSNLAPEFQLQLTHIVRRHRMPSDDNKAMLESVLKGYLTDSQLAKLEARDLVHVHSRGAEFLREYLNLTARPTSLISELECARSKETAKFPNDWITPEPVCPGLTWSPISCWSARFSDPGIIVQLSHVRFEAQRVLEQIRFAYIELNSDVSKRGTLQSVIDLVNLLRELHTNSSLSEDDIEQAGNCILC